MSFTDKIKSIFTKKSAVIWDEGEKLESIDLIDEFEEHIGYKFSDSFRKWVIKNNGKRPDCVCIFDTDVDERVLDSLFSFNKDDDCSIWEMNEWDDYDDPEDEDEQARTDFMRNYVIIGDSAFGDYICFDKADGKVVYVDHETDDVEHIGKDFDEFLSKLRRDDEDDE